MSTSSSTPALQAPGLTITSTIASQSDNTPHSYSHVPILTKDNYGSWQLSIRAYLTPNKHMHVILHKKDSASMLHDPVAPTDAVKKERWEQSEAHAMGVIMGTAADLHFELISKHAEGAVWPLWKAIKDKHILKDASLCHEAWMHLLSIRKVPEEVYLDMYRRVDEAHGKIDHITPDNQSKEMRSDEIMLFTILNRLPADDRLHNQLVAQKDVTLDDAYAAFLCVDRDTALVS